MKKTLIIVSNFFWYLSSLPALLAFRKSCRNVRSSQIKILREQCRNTKKLHSLKNCKTSEELLAKFAEVPLTEYEDYAEDVNLILAGTRRQITESRVSLLMPTSGTSGGTKLIPYNRTLLDEYRRGTSAWIAKMFQTNPALFAGKHYWSITPNTECNSKFAGSDVPVGFDSDTEYLSPLQRFFSRQIMAVPDKVAKIADMKAFEYITLLFLVKEPALRFISVWHPSFLTLLLEKLPGYLEDIVTDIEKGTIKSELDIDKNLLYSLKKQIRPDAKRAQQLRSIFQQTSAQMSSNENNNCEIRRTEAVQNDFANLFTRIWPNLKLISCWRGNECEPFVRELQKWFPQAKIEAKGIVATEGIISFPLGTDNQKVLSVNSHFFEFKDEVSGEIKFAWQLENGRIYSVIITTGSGFCRYQLHDRIKVSGFFEEAPLIEFLGRDNIVSDMTGEKLHISHIDKMIAELDRKFNISAKFAAVIPKAKAEINAGAVGYYKLYIYTEKCELRTDIQEIEKFSEEILSENFHYHHARNLGQLNQMQIVFLNSNPTKAIRSWLIESGKRAGDIKIPRLLSQDVLEIIECTQAEKEAA